MLKPVVVLNREMSLKKVVEEDRVVFGKLDLPLNDPIPVSFIEHFSRTLLAKGEVLRIFCWTNIRHSPKIMKCQ